jgi:hypothetical protein
MVNRVCKNCGLPNFSGEVTCKRCGAALPIVQEAISDTPQTINPPPQGSPQPGVPHPGDGYRDSRNPSYDRGAASPQRVVGGMTKSQGNILIALLCVVIALVGIGTGWSAWSASRPKPAPKYEYKVLRLFAGSKDRTGAEALSFTSIQIPDADLATIGAEGWELVGTLLEMETAFPNFGKEEYVTGMQPNVRPQSAILLFKREKK